jgi:hypothetical protein
VLVERRDERPARFAPERFRYVRVDEVDDEVG